MIYGKFIYGAYLEIGRTVRERKVACSCLSVGITVMKHSGTSEAANGVGDFLRGSNTVDNYTELVRMRILYRLQLSHNAVDSVNLEFKLILIVGGLEIIRNSFSYACDNLVDFTDKNRISSPAMDTVL